MAPRENSQAHKACGIRVLEAECVHARSPPGARALAEEPYILEMKLSTDAFKVLRAGLQRLFWVFCQHPV